MCSLTADCVLLLRASLLARQADEDERREVIIGERRGDLACGGGRGAAAEEEGGKGGGWVGETREERVLEGEWVSASPLLAACPRLPSLLQAQILKSARYSAVMV